MRRSPVLAALATATALCILGSSAQAATFEVTRTNDPAPNGCKKRDCSLREAVIAANNRNGADAIVLPRRATYRLSQAGNLEDESATGDLDITGRLTIRHPGKGRAKINANGIDRVLHIPVETAPLTLSKIEVRGGANPGADAGGILADSDVTLLRSWVIRNTADDGAGIDMDTDADLVMRRSKVLHNVADDLGGGINGGSGRVIIVGSRVADNTSADDEGGGVDGAGGTLIRIVDSVIENNTAGADGAGGVDAHAERVVIKRTSIVRNVADGDGGGVFAEDAANIKIDSSVIARNSTVASGGLGGGVYLTSSGTQATVVNSTIAHNTADSLGGGVFAGSGAEASIRSSTVARNQADPAATVPAGLAGGGLFRDSSGPFEVRNSLIGLNRSGATPNDCEGDGPFDSLGNNLLSTDSGGLCEGFDRPSDRIANPRIGPLKRNGGPTRTIALKRGSPAIGNAHKGSSPKRDQRGRKRDKKPDIGAFERGA